MCKPLLWLFCLLALSGAACMISEQSGQDIEDLTFHFDTGFNRAVLFGRSSLLAIVGLWFFAGGKRSAVPVLLAVGCIGTAGWLLIRDYPTLHRYRVQVLGNGLVLSIPPESEKTLAWTSIEGMYVEGMGSGAVPRDEFERRLQLPDWHLLRITEAGGATHDMDLRPLSVEQRQILWRAIARRANLVEIRE
jgi:hypothetical protein